MKEIRQRKILGRNVFLYEAILEKVMYFVKYSNMISNMEMIVHWWSIMIVQIHLQQDFSFEAIKILYKSSITTFT